jgi:hypothetical protein
MSKLLLAMSVTTMIATGVIDARPADLDDKLAARASHFVALLRSAQICGKLLSSEALENDIALDQMIAHGRDDIRDAYASGVMRVALYLQQHGKPALCESVAFELTSNRITITAEDIQRISRNAAKLPGTR